MGSNPGVCIVSSPRSIASVVPFSNFVDILGGIFRTLYIITGNEGARVLKDRKNVTGYSIDYVPGRNIFSRILGHILLELKVVSKILLVRGYVDLYVFFMAEGIVLPLLLAKITRKPILLVLAGSTIEILKKNRDVYSKPFELIEYVNYWLADRIVIYSPAVIGEWGLANYKNKISVAHEHFLDFKTINIKKTLSERDELVGYIGRLSQEKGILNFMQSIQETLRLKNNVTFLIGGDGQLKNMIESYLDQKILNDKVELCGWIPHDDIVNYFNKIKLLVLPSYTEGLPNVMLEALACGTPVLVTKVGAIPDVIRDEETGFILENNSPECIAKNVFRALTSPRLEQIAKNGNLLVRNEFTYEKAVERYREIFKQINIGI